MYYLGVDPGKTGGFALLDSKGHIIFSSLFKSFLQIRIALHLYKTSISSCAIEKVASMHKQGVKSVFTFGTNYGGWLAYLEMFGISHQLIPPTRWQNKLLGHFPKGESKKRSLDFVQRKYPKLKLKKSDHGISDAICLALYAIILDRRRP